MKTPKRILTGVLKTFLEGVSFPGEYAGAICPFAGQPMFQAVKVFDMEDILEAFAELFVFKDRVAIICIDQEHQATDRLGMNLAIRFAVDFALLISDRSYKDRQLALNGDATTPGVLLISDVLVEAIAGEIAPAYVCEPKGGDLLGLTGRDRENNIGRIAWRQDVTLHGGRLVRPLSRLALQTYAPMGN